MNYCTLDEAWGNNILKDSRKKKKIKRLYTSKIPSHIYDKSYEEEGHDTTCVPKTKKTFTVKNKHRYDKSRGAKDIYRPKRSSRVDNIELRYDEANREYKRYRKESKRNTKNNLSNSEIIDQNIRMAPTYAIDNEVLGYIEGDEVAEYNTIQENDMELHNMTNSPAYNMDDDDSLQQKMQQLREQQAQVLAEQRQIVAAQKNNNVVAEPPINSPMESFDNYYENSNIEPFENDNLDLHNLEETQEEERMNQIQDVEVRPSFSNSNYQEEEDLESENVIDNLINKKMNKKQAPAPAIEVNDEDTSDSENESEDEALNYVDTNKGDLEYRINNLNRNMNLIIKKMNSTHIFDGDTEENIHDIILFVLFGIFIIFVLDTIYRFGKNSGK
jgi:hypothetical protein